MEMITLTKEELEWIMEKRRQQEEEEYRIARLEHGKALMLEGYEMIMKNGGTVSITGGGYVRTGAFLTEIKETKKGIQFDHQRK